jgi:hypothetical protein
MITWPTNSLGYLLQQNASLMTTNWVDATNTVAVNGTNNQVIVTPETGAIFFRLRHP